jgi:hypothetical protein
MSTLWTPDGERPIPRPAPASSLGGVQAARQAAAEATEPSSGEDIGLSQGGPSQEDLAAMAELQRQLAEAPPELVVSNHAFGLFELAAVHLSQQPPQLPQARLAIDALSALVEGLAGRLGEAEPQLREGLAQLQLAFVQIHAASQAPAQPPAQPPRSPAQPPP